MKFTAEDENEEMNASVRPAPPSRGGRGVGEWEVVGSVS